MKRINDSSYGIILTLLLTAGCGKFDKHPVQNLNEFRAMGLQERQLGPESPQIIREEIPVEVPVQIIREVETNSTPQDRFIVISPDPDMTFTEGRTSRFKVRARVTLAGAKINLIAQDLPQGAVFREVSTPQDPGTYELSWTVPIGVVPENSLMHRTPIKFMAQVVQVSNPSDRQLLDASPREREVYLTVFKDFTPPTQLTITDLPTEVLEGSLTKFYVTVRVPGIDAEAVLKPQLLTFFDGLSIDANSPFQERDGSRHVTIDTDKPTAEYLGDQTWRFYRVFDTRNIPPQSQLNGENILLPDADGVRVRLSFKVFSPNGTSTPHVLHRMKIKYHRPLTAPRFDLSWLGQDTLDVIPGENLTINFYVESLDPRASVLVQIPQLTQVVGAPRMVCQNSQLGAYRQACTLRWGVPCQASEGDLTLTIPLSAVSQVDGQSSETAHYELKVKKSPASSNCPINPESAEATP